MDTIKIRIDYDKEVKINNEYTCQAPVKMNWFPENDLIVETPFEKIVFNTNGKTQKDGEVYVITPQKEDNNLTPVNNIKLQLVKNNLAYYLIINDKYAYKLPSNTLDIV